VRFGRRAAILLAWPDPLRPGHHPLQRLPHERMQKNLFILEQATDQTGPFRVIKVPLPEVIERNLTPRAYDDNSTMWHNTGVPGRARERNGRRRREQVPPRPLEFRPSPTNSFSCPPTGKWPRPRRWRARVAGIFQDAVPAARSSSSGCTELNLTTRGLTARRSPTQL